MITLRKLQLTDNKALFPIYSNKKITRPAGFLPYHYQKQINEQMSEFLETHTAIILDNELIGVIVSDQLSDTSISLGIMISEKHQNHGYGKKAIQLYLKQLKKGTTIYCDCLIKNIASHHLLESCGFIYKQDFKRMFPDFPDEKTCRLYQFEMK